VVNSRQGELQFYNTWQNATRARIKDFMTNHANEGRLIFEVADAGQTLNEAMRIETSGNVGIGTTNPSEKLHVIGNILASGSITPGSSRKLKDNIRDLEANEALAVLLQLTPTKFYYKADHSDEQLGFIAEDVPELVATKDRMGVAPMDIVAVLTKVVQQQQADNEAQSAKIKEKDRRIKALRKELESQREELKSQRKSIREIEALLGLKNIGK